MLQHEFENRVGMKVSATEYNAIEEVYMASEIDKDAFCKLWIGMNRMRIKSYKAKQKEMAEEAKLRWYLIDLRFKLRSVSREKQTTFAELYISNRDRKNLEKAGISLVVLVYNTSGELVLERPKDLLDLRQDISKYLDTKC